MNNSTIRWGIIGAGIIAHQMSDAISASEGNELVAVASRTAPKARDFAGKYGISAETYESLIARADIDVIYIATTHNFHCENALQALAGNKNLVIEKPFTVNADQAEQIARAARERNLFVMEAIWTRFLPSMQALREQVAEGVLGKVKVAHVTFGGISADQYRGRLYDPALAGGVTLDMGIYPISMLCCVLGELPTAVTGRCLFSDTGIDETASYQLTFASGCIATVNTSINMMLGQTMTLYGDEGRVNYPDFQGKGEYTLTQLDGRETTEEGVFGADNADNGFIHQVEEAARCLRAGLSESPIIPLGESVAIMKVLDDLRHQFPLRYDFE
ncbi:Gfo/Idh/MocA family oxidoreductase [Gilvimarinus sp. SDUM040013]|uniref:Gfo/Idh/MocA family oxidoreductase n=1 Tax=Gilvimarinus gilvus TaxID=3058038 RepID=A0ABU4S2N2_9GAMM|nr:Gfo/Idh/MocA family oxidoreductase [Gilvimarinus sp. SDUM040013]MDO3384591.1 Gfo/Idh/MocA family oxidoreductase [Gilvimarinus sp. SDUM040013]MDX6850073.1 Gfo/Idh/MocA family oxidoreductase [Gilvimarinus sp. SDUM040013]